MNYKISISVGCLIWIVSFLGEASEYQPYSTIGMLISAFLLTYGLFYWFKSYKATKGHYPKFWAAGKSLLTKTRSNPFAGMAFLFKHVLEFWTFCIVFWIALVLLGYFTFRQSKAFEVTKNYCKSNKTLLAKTGDIRYFGVLVNGTISSQGSSGNANLSFTIVGSNGNFSANSEVSKEAGEWAVENLTLE